MSRFFESGVSQVELLRADDIAFAGESEELALDRVEAQLARNRLGQDPVERVLKQLAMDRTVRRHVLVAVGDPDVVDAGRAERPAHVRRNLAAGNRVIDPESADGLIAAGEREPACGHGMREVSGVHVEPGGVRAGPVNPAAEVPGLELIAVHPRAAGLGIHGVKVDAVPAGEKAQRLLEVGAKLVAVGGAAHVVARREDAAGKHGIAFQSGDVIALPAVQRNRRGEQRPDRFVGVHPERGVALAREGIGGFFRFSHDCNSPCFLVSEIRSNRRRIRTVREQNTTRIGATRQASLRSIKRR